MSDDRTLSLRPCPSRYRHSGVLHPRRISHHNSGTLRGELSGCVAEEKRLIAEIEKYFAIEIGKKANKQIVNMTTMLADVKAIESKMLYAKPKIAGKNYYDGGMTLIRNLRAKLEKEIVS